MQWSPVQEAENKVFCRQRIEFMVGFYYIRGGTT